MTTVPEYAFVLRLPEHLADQIDIACDDDSIDEKLSMCFKDNRHASLKFENQTFDASVCDLPTITEVFKTVDRASYFKSVDLCQMILIHNKDQQSQSSSAVVESSSNSDILSGQSLSSGILTNPLPKPPTVENGPSTTQMDPDALPDYIKPGRVNNHQLRDGLTFPTEDIINIAWRHFHLPDDFNLKEKEELLLRLVYGEGEQVELEPVTLDAHQIAHIIGQQRGVLRPEDSPTDDLIKEVLQLKKKQRKERRDDKAKVKKEVTEDEGEVAMEQ
ncbi:hypothetical protein GEMRC1_006146 [Eukaryota sp. GEM-RC1]